MAASVAQFGVNGSYPHAPLHHRRSQVNVDAAESAEAHELLTEDGAPHCFSSQGEALKCPMIAARTTRAGQYELEVCFLVSNARTPRTPIPATTYVHDT